MLILSVKTMVCSVNRLTELVGRKLIITISYFDLKVLFISYHWGIKPLLF